MLLNLLSILVPAPYRTTWLREWHAELFVASQYVVGWQYWRFAYGAFADAWALRFDRDLFAENLIRTRRSPGFCLFTLSLLSTPSAYFALPPLSPIHGAALGVAAVFTWCLTPHRTWFFGAKLTLACAALSSLYRFFAVIPNWLPSRPTDLGTNVMLDFILLILFFTCAIGLTRWVVEDEYLRCPDCRNRLSDEVTLGDVSRPFLSASGMGRLCEHGHGTLFEPVWTPATQARPQWHSL